MPLGIGGAAGAILLSVIQLLIPDAELVQIIPVKLVPLEQQGGILRVDELNRCKNGKHPGCLLFEKDKEGYITFYIVNEKPSKNCDTGATRVITEIELSTKELTAQAESDRHAKGDFTGGVDPWIKNSAFNSVNQRTGIVYQATWKDGWTQVALTNLNKHDAAEGVKQFWYKVTVTACAGGEGEHATWVTDPRGDNEGKN